MSTLYTDLLWLRPTPSDFRQQLQALRESQSLSQRDLFAITSFSLDATALDLVRRLAHQREIFARPDVRLCVLSNGTLDFVCAAIEATGFRHGLTVRADSAGFGQALQMALDATSPLYQRDPTVVLIALDWRAYPLARCAEQPSLADALVEQSVALVQQLVQAIQVRSAATCVVQNLAIPPERTVGSMSRIVPGSVDRAIRHFNSQLDDLASREGLVLFDVDSLAGTVGSAEWCSAGQWHLAKLPFADRMVPLYADTLCRLLASLRGKAKKCLVLDLDNTLWGGVIGDDGLEGIRLAQGDAIGEAYLDFQRYVLQIRASGVVLAVSSKNDDAVARRPFREHPEMLIREEHIAVFQANWHDKPTNIAAIARQLNLGLDSFVFADDNPFERTAVRTTLHEVAVPELPDDAAWYARTLSAAGYFTTHRQSAEDQARANYYAADARRAELQKQVGDVDAYLRSLGMVIHFAPFDPVGRARIAQLINKSNQFNLTTRRYAEAEVQGLEGSDAHITLQVRLSDTLGDNGMISVVIGEIREHELVIDSWLMSCRVLGRKVEQAVLAELAARCRARGIEVITGRFIPSGRNDLVRRHYKDLGFDCLREAPDGSSEWRLRLEDLAPIDLPFRVERVDAPSAALGAT